MGLCVLIVDDEAHIRAGIKAKLNWDQLGVDRLIEAGDGVEALELAHKRSPDMIITDIRMPEYDGLSLIRDLYEQGHSAKIIIISGYADFEYAKRAMTYGVKSYLLKPIEPDQLEKEVSLLIEDIHNAKQKEDEWIQLRNIYESSLKQSLDQQLSDFLYEPGQAGRLLPKLNEAGFAGCEGNFVVAALKIKPFDLEKLDFRYRFTSEDMDLFMFCVKNMIRDLIHFPKPYIFFKNVRKSQEFVFLFYIDNEFSLSSVVKNQLENVIVKIKEFLKIESAAAIGENVTLSDQYSKGYRQAFQALSETIVRGY